MTARLIMLVILLLAAAPARAAEVEGLYRAETLVTGTEEPERTRGMRIGLREVLTKLSGRAELPKSAALTAALKSPHGFVTAFEYEDRMKDIPIHDEQGTRERPHFLRMTFDKAKIDALLAQMELKAWSSNRPRLTVLLMVRDAQRSYVLTTDGENGYGQRMVMLSASRHTGVPILLPSEAAIHDAGLTPERVEQGGDQLAEAAKTLGGDGLLLGRLTLTSDGAAWDVRWRLDGQGVRAAWTREGVSFDEALRGAVARAALALSSAR